MKTATEIRMVGMPKEWQRRLTGCWWLLEYWAIHCSLVRLPSIRRDDTTDCGMLAKSKSHSLFAKSAKSGAAHPPLTFRTPSIARLPDPFHALPGLGNGPRGNWHAI